MERSLREIKKQLTREAIARAALRLTMEKGLSSVTLDDIAHGAFVSPRTVTNYFPTKEEAVLAAGADGMLDVLDHLEAGDTDEAPLTALRRLLSDYARQEPDQLGYAAQAIELEAANPTLMPHRTALMARMTELLRDRIAARTDTDPHGDPYPSLVASAAVGALESSLLLWIRDGRAPGALPHLIEEAFDVVIAGYPTPSSAD